MVTELTWNELPELAVLEVPLVLLLDVLLLLDGCPVTCTWCPTWLCN